MLRTLFAATAALGAVYASTPAAAQSGTALPLRGTMRCENLPGVTAAPLAEPFTLAVAGSQAEYSHSVRQADATVDAAPVERGSGIVSPDGWLTLTGAAQGQTFRYTAQYHGQLPPGGGPGYLEGVQHWEQRDRPDFARRCTIDLSR